MALYWYIHNTNYIKKALLVTFSFENKIPMIIVFYEFQGTKRKERQKEYLLHEILYDKTLPPDTWFVAKK